MRISSLALLAAAVAVAASCAPQLKDDVTPSIKEPAKGALPADPGLLCNVQHPAAGTPVLVHGDGFSPLPEGLPAEAHVVLPSIKLDGKHALDGSASSVGTLLYAGTSDGENGALLSWQSQQQMTFLVEDSLAIKAGLYDVEITSPDGKTTATSHESMGFVDPPVVTSVDKPIVCLDQGPVDVTITGSDALTIDGTAATVKVGNQALTPTLDGCTAIAHNGYDAQDCSSLTVTLAQSSLQPGSQAVVVENPAPASCTSAANGSSIFVVPAPAIAQVSPAEQCQTAESATTTLTVSGAGFLVVGGTAFTVTVNGADATPTPGSCIDAGVPGQQVQTCSSFTVAVDTTSLPIGPVPIVVTNPAPANCTATASADFQIVGPPSITGVVPSELCSDVPATTIRIDGTNLVAGSVVSVDGTAADSVVADGTTAGSIDATFNNGIPAGSHSVTVDNGGGCNATANAAITVDPTPIVFFVDPPVDYNGITLEATVFVSGLAADAASVELVDSGGAKTQLAFTSAGSPGRILATIPSGLAPGAYQVEVTSAVQCVSVIDGQLQVSDTTTISIAAPSTTTPVFVSPTVPTAITITATNPTPAGDEDFQNLPAAYLNPSSGNGDAIQLSATELVSAQQLSAVVQGAPVGTYDLVIVNPDGAVGLSPAAVTVTQNEPPIVTAVSPGSFVTNADTNDVTILGEHFDNPSSVTLSCKDFATGASLAQTSKIVINGSTSTSISVNVLNATGGSTVPAGAVCVLTVTNADGSTFDFSAVSFDGASGNLDTFKDSGSQLNEARSNLGLAAGRPTNTSRFVYAIGGDAGTTATAKTTVESAFVDPFGVVTGPKFDGQRNSLANVWNGTATVNAPRTRAGAVTVGRFIYLVGGDDGTGAQSTVLRAQILDPLAAPSIDDLDGALGDGTSGLTQGLWLYKVSALFPTTDASNPGGESLPGELFNVELPNLQQNILLTLHWNAVAGASGYRVYRTPAANDDPSQLQLLGETGANATSLVDSGQATDATKTPLPQGSLGVWDQVTTLAVPRSSAGVVAVPSPTNPDQVFVYAAGGVDANPSARDDVELATITIASDGTQTITPFAVTTNGTTTKLSVARSELVAVSMSSADTPSIGLDTHLFFLSGRNQAGGATKVVDFATIDATTGAIVALNTPRTQPGAQFAGSTGFQSGGIVVEFGGAGGNASTNNIASHPQEPQCSGSTGTDCPGGVAGGFVCGNGSCSKAGDADGDGVLDVQDTATSTAVNDPCIPSTASPTCGLPAILSSFNANGGGTILTARVFAGGAVESAFLFVGGGLDATAAPLATVEQTVQ